MLLTFAFANAQCKIYSGKYATYSNQVGLFEDGKIYSGKYATYSKQVGLIENGKIYSGKYATYSKQVGLIEGGGMSCAAAAAFLLLF